jgi:hypothetical protein
MKLSRRAAAVGASVCAAAVMLSTAAPAQAAVTGWRLFSRQHYGAPANFSAYLAVVASGKSSAWAFGGTALRGAPGGPGQPVAEHWDGRAWRGSPLPGGLSDSIDAASAASATDVWAVTRFGGYVLHWNGVRWSVAKRLRGSGQLTGVTALSARDVWVFGGRGATGGLGTWHFDGQAWRQWTGNARGLESASAVSAVNIWAIGGLLTPFSAIMHFDGRSWRPVTAKALSGLSFGDIHAFSRNDIWASAIAGNSSSSLSAWLVHFNGAQWTRVAVPWKVIPDRIAADGQGGLWLSAFGLADQPFVVHRTASGRWSRTAISTLLFGLALIPGTASLWGVSLAPAQTGADAAIWAYGKIG